MAKRQKQETATASDLVRSDGTLALCFVNTASSRRGRVCDYAGLLAWGAQHGALSSGEATRLERCAVDQPEETAETFEEAERLRLLLSEIFNALADRKPPSSEAIEAFNGHLARTLPPRRLVRSKTGLRPDWATSRDDLTRPLWRVVSSAFATLKSEDSARLARCAGEGCGILFLANNPGRPRKWCDMKTCGNRAKARRRYYGKIRPYRQELHQEVDELQRERVKARHAAKRQDD